MQRLPGRPCVGSVKPLENSPLVREGIVGMADMANGPTLIQISPSAQSLRFQESRRLAGESSGAR